jgi:chemotaxis protein CheD
MQFKTETEEKAKYFIQPGYIFVCREPHLLSTVLGSCVSVCTWDSDSGFGGMNHYILPKPFNKERTARFGSISIPHLIKSLVDLGAEKHKLKCHIVGGAQNPAYGSAIVGKENIKIAENLIKKHYIDIVTFDTGGELGRKVVFDTETGEIVIYKVNSLRENDWYKDEKG